ncbi:MAG: carboxypeptidase-like regulatory domain-containing protein [Bacteroidota bacterium]
MKNLVVILTVIAAIMFSISVYADNNDNVAKTNTTQMSGKVVDKETGEPLAGVMVKIVELEQVVYTDFDGNFTFTDVKPGNYNVSTQYISYRSSFLKDVALKNANNTLKIELNSN